MQYIHACEHVVRACWSKLKLLFMTQPIQLSHNSRHRANKKKQRSFISARFQIFGSEPVDHPGSVQFTGSKKADL
jgi:hypothetical protein